MTEISIIIPCYNCEKYVAKCLNSILAQTFENWEALVIDNNSKDATGKIIKEYAQKDSRIKYLFDKRPGPATARNLGLANASGKYLMFCDADDWYEPEMCDVMHNDMVTNDVDVVCCGANVQEEDNVKRIESVDYYQNNYQGNCPIDTALILKTNCVLWNKIFKKSVVDKWHITFPDGHKSDDKSFYLKYMSVASRILFEDKKLYNYLRLSNSIMGTWMQNLQQYLEDDLYVAKDYLDFLKTNQLYDKYKRVFFGCLYLPALWCADDKTIAHLKKCFLDIFGKNDFLYRLTFPEDVFCSSILTISKSLVCRHDTFYDRLLVKLFGKKILSIKIKKISPLE